MALSDLELMRLSSPRDLELTSRTFFPGGHSIADHFATKKFAAAPSYEELEPIRNSTDLKIGPSGLDLTIGSHMAESNVLRTSLDGKDFRSLNPKDIYGKEQVLDYDREGNKVYYFLSDEKLDLPFSLDYFVDARSTTGRVGVMCHQVGRLFDGEVIIAVQPFAFPIKITSGKTSLSQAVIRKRKSRFMHYDELREGHNNKEKSNGINFYRGKKDVFIESLMPEGLVMTFSSGLVYSAKKCNDPIDMDVNNEIDPSLYFEIIEGNGEFGIDSKTFCLAGTREVIDLENVCGRISRESYVSGTGLWSQFAGIVQAGFHGPITLECYSLGNRIIRDGEAAGIVIFDKIDGPVLNKYGGSYQNQTAPRLPKMFKQFANV